MSGQNARSDGIERFWSWFKEDITTPRTMIVLGFFALLILSALIATLRKGKSGNGFVLWDVVAAIATWFK